MEDQVRTPVEELLAPGDPVKLARVIDELAGHEHPPLRLAAGTDAVDAIAVKLDAMRAELDRWQDPSRTTDITSGIA
ncbi:hypothetical protein PQR71_36705 [Paraburkholderia fungorum]|uniref:hypothetical protein n=1 Tax=Paraburkholderia fungorum TaxID=134537 RepID=UPI0038B7F5A4